MRHDPIGMSALDSAVLNERDIERLLTERTPAARIDVLGKIAVTHMERAYSLEDVAVAEQILRILVKDTEVSVREALSLRLKNNPYIPRDIIVALANDTETVALPVLEESPVLLDSDLITIIHNCRSVAKQAAIAIRNPVSEEVSVALVATYNAEVVEKLTGNAGARIPAETYADIFHDHGKNKIIVKALSERPNLPVTLKERVIALISDSLATNLQAKYDLSPAIASSETEKTREIATLMLIDGEADKHNIEKLVEQLHSFHRLTPSIILTSLCRGNLYFFETSLAQLSNIPLRNAQVLIHDKGGLGFKALYSKAALPDKFFTACKELVEVVAAYRRKNSAVTGAAYANAVIQELLAKTSGRNIDNLSYVIALIRQAA